MSEKITVKLSDLEVFAEVTETRNFRMTAERLGVAQSQISRAIARFEEGLGVQLFHRNRKAVSLTDAAEGLLPDVRKALDAARQLESAARVIKRNRLNTITVGAPSSIPMIQTCARIIRSFGQSNPECKIVVRELGIREQIEGLLNGSLDVGICILPMRGRPATIRIEDIHSEPLLLAIPEDHPLSKHRTVPMSRLKEQPFITYSPHLGGGLCDLTTEVCARAGFQPIVSQVAFLIPIAVSLVAAGLGVAFVPASVATLQAPGVTYRPVEDKRATTRLALLSRKNERLALTKKFLQIGRSWSA